MQKELKDIPLCVDLDGTLIAGDTLTESILSLIKIKPWYLFFLPVWIAKGKNYFKHKVADHILPDPAELNYREDLIDYIKEARNQGREIVLATATVKAIADSVSEYTGLFDKVIASTPEVNVRSSFKTAALVKEYGEGGYDYAGDSKADLKVWEKANSAIVVHATNTIEKKAINSYNVKKVFKNEYSYIKTFIKEIRVYQWLKNLLIFLPLLMAHKISQSEPFLLSFLAFLSFSLSASAVYVLNDLMDLESDRHHPRKKFRPLASGRIKIPHAVIYFFLLLFAGISISVFLLPANFSLVLFLYLILTTAYSFLLKRIYIVDIFVLSILYTIRLIAGAAAVDVPASKWLLAFSVFIFLSLAIVKRYTELRVVLSENKTESKGRAYHVDDIGLLLNLGPSSAYLAVLVFALYINSPEVVNLYKHPVYLWPVAIFILFWITRIWFIAHRGKMHDDPIVFTGKDYVSYIIGFIIGLLVIGAAI